MYTKELKFNKHMEESKQHVQVPDPIKKNRDLKPVDYLVYANIRRYMNKDTKTCYPSLSTIARDCDLSIPTIRTSINRLEQCNLITTIKQPGHSTIYKFKELLKDFERFTPEFLDNPDMTSEEKAYVIGLQSQSFKNEDYAVTTYSNSELSENLNIPERSIRRYNQSLKEKEIMLEIETAIKDEAGFNVPAKAVDLHKIGQAVLFISKVVDNHEDRITRLEKMIELLVKENKNLRHENELLKSSKEVIPVEYELDKQSYSFHNE